jgi:pyridoxamine 5'-phosphate oxidase
MTLATASPQGAPAARVVLLKGVDGAGGFLFFTNYESRKGRELAENPRAALVFHWQPLGRQVRVEGAVERTSKIESDAYFRTRPRGSRIGAWASPQSRPVPSREALEKRVAEVEAAHPGPEVPLPPWWGGFRLVPRTIEFWQHGADRLHDRIRFDREEDAWRATRIAP